MQKKNDLDNLLRKCEKICSDVDLEQDKILHIEKFLKQKIYTKNNFVFNLEQSLINKCRNIFASVNIDQILAAKMKETIFYNLSNRKPWYFFHFIFSHKKIWSFLVLLAFTVGIFGSLVITTAPEVYAKETILHIESGNVEVRRDGQPINPSNGFLVKQGDVIKTFDNANVYLEYPNGNRSDMDSNTFIYLERLDFNLSDDTNSDVKIYLNDGRLLNNIYNSMLSDSRFEVDALNVNIEAIQAVFDVELNKIKEQKERNDEQQNEIKVSVLNSFVDVKVSNDETGEIVAKTLFENNQLQASGNGEYKTVDLSNEAIEKDQWLAKKIKEQNQSKKQMAQNTDNLGPDNLSLKSIENVVSSFLPKDKREETKQELSDIRILFKNAEYYRSKGLLGNAEDVLEEIEQRMENIFKTYNDLNSIDEVAGQMEEMIAYYRRYRTRLIPGISYDKYLNSFNKLELLMIDDELGQNKIKLDQAFEDSLVALNGDNLDTQNKAIVHYIELFAEALNFAAGMDEEDLKTDFLKNCADKSLNLVKSIAVKYGNDSYEYQKQAFAWQSNIQNIIEDYLDNSANLVLSNINNQIAGVLINLTDSSNTQSNIDTSSEAVDSMEATPEVKKNGNN